ncbi:MAG: Uma2 family endonuclease [Desulfotomaculum sp.]|nr:Uma2 family endonuclease [Desulfotomaculum sp.]
MNPLAKKESCEYSYSDYLKWPAGERWELVQGVACNMGPAPSRRHQEISGELFYQIKGYLQNNKTCKVYDAPFDVRLSPKTKDEDIKTVVQPDLVVVCDLSKLDDRGCLGSPDLIIEIISPSTISWDYITKLSLYEKNKIKEYWIVHPVDKTVMVFKLEKNNKYSKPDIYTEENRIKVGLFTELEIDLKKVFAD